MNKTLILTVEDDRPVRNLIVTTLKTHDYKYLTAENGNEAVMEAASHNPDIILLDLGLPDMDGIEVIKRIRTWSNMPIIVISARSEDTDKIEALDAGADDYITKPCDPEELVLRIKNILKRNQPVLEKLIKIGTYVFHPNQLQLSYQEEKFQLTEKEAELLSFLIQNNQKLVSRKEILEKIWGENDYFMGRSLDVFMTRLRKYFQNDETIKFESVRGIGFKINFPL